MKQTTPVPAGAAWVDRDPAALAGSPFERIGKQWMLITASTGDNWNTMTAAWGGLGVLWGRNVAFAFIRPSRHTFAFATEAPLLTLSFFGPERRGALELCGAESGRDVDKAARAGLTPVVFGDRGRGMAGAVAFEEASDVLVCRTLYTHDLDPSRFPEEVERIYGGKDYHRMFIGEVLGLLGKGG